MPRSSDAPPVQSALSSSVDGYLHLAEQDHACGLESRGLQVIPYAKFEGDCKRRAGVLQAEGGRTCGVQYSELEWTVCSSRVRRHPPTSPTGARVAVSSPCSNAVDVHLHARVVRVRTVVILPADRELLCRRKECGRVSTTCISAARACE